MDGVMKRYRTVAWLVNLATVLVAWHGMLLSLPHTHHDLNVPQYAEVCSAARAGSTVVHLHPAPELIPPHGCLACLVSSAHGTPAAGRASAVLRVALRIPPQRAISHRPDRHRHLPSLRAPPSRS